MLRFNFFFTDPPFFSIQYQEENDDSEAESSDNDSDDSQGRTRDSRARQKRRMNDDTVNYCPEKKNTIG